MCMIEINRLSIVDQETECIVNAWNRNFIPFFLLFSQGVSRAIRKKSGNRPFWELMRFGLLDVGEAVLTSSGELPYKGIIHVAGLHAYWTASEESIRVSTKNAVQLAIDSGFSSIAIPLIGSGTGAIKKERSKKIISEEAYRYGNKIRIVISDYGYHAPRNA